MANFDARIAHVFQWLGEQDLRFGMEGRILLARLMCKDPSGFLHSAALEQESPGVVTHAFSTPCIAFRVAGSQGVFSFNNTNYSVLLILLNGTNPLH